jgi:hypothetical protein
LTFYQSKVNEAQGAIAVSVLETPPPTPVEFENSPSISSIAMSDDLRPILKKTCIGNLFRQAFIELQNCSEAYDCREKLLVLVLFMAGKQLIS